MVSLSLAPSPGSLKARLFSFVVEQHPFALPFVEQAWAEVGRESERPEELQRLSDDLSRVLDAKVRAKTRGLPETTPGTSAEDRFLEEKRRLLASVRGFFERRAVQASITDEERLWILRGIALTRAVDNRMKQMFLSGELRYGELGFQGKGFRSLGQEAIYAAALRLRRGPAHRRDGRWHGDVVAPLIRDLGVALAFTDDVVSALNAQAGKIGLPMEGRDFHLGDYARGVVPAAAPLTIAGCTAIGVGLAMKLRGEDRVAVSFIGEGGSSLGEWHESINLAATRRLPVVFCLENNQTALSTPVSEQSAARVFGEKALGYGIPHVTIDGTDADEVAAAFAWAADRARRGEGPTLIDVVAMRLCGHAHHDDMLYLGSDPPLAFEVPELPGRGYVDAERYRFWAQRDPLARYAERVLERGLIDAAQYRALLAETAARVDEAMEELKARPWPDPRLAGAGVTSDGPVLGHPPPLAIPPLPGAGDASPEVEDAPPFSPKGVTYLEAIARGVGDVLDRLPEAFVFGEDVGPPYGNAFLLLKPLLDRHGERILNSTLAEAGLIGACVGAALEGMRPLGEIQFNDFVATGMNELVNNAAKAHYRTGLEVPMVLRMPFGGLRRAGPYHSQDTAPWFYRTFGLKIVCPSTPHDARALLMSAALDDNPVLYYEHIALYREPRIKQLLDDAPPAPIPLGKAAFRRLGEDLSLLAYGAYVHRALRAAERISAEEGASVEVVDLRSLAPLDWAAIETTVRRTGKVLLVGEDSRTGSILESIASRIGESLYEHLDGPVRVLGALDCPVPYAPSLEDAFLVSDDLLVETARALLRY